MIRVFVCYYKPSNPIRKAEIDYCLSKNLENKLISLRAFEYPGNPPVRPHFDYYFQMINKVTENEDINIIANADIFFDETIELANKIGHKELYALTQWDTPTKLSPHHNMCQASWIFRGPVFGVEGRFELGNLGSDNRIAYEFEQAGYKVTNPCLSIKTHHVHQSNIRNYGPTVPGPYIQVRPCKLS